MKSKNEILQPPRSPESFEDLRDSLNASGVKWTLTGGQAVNLWALKYQVSDPKIRFFSPFMSKDLDPVIAPSDLRKLPPNFRIQNTWGLSPLVGTIDNNRGEVLSRVPGLAGTEVSDFNRRIDNWNVLSPAALLKAKLWNFINIPNTDGYRQDGKHLAILATLLPTYLSDKLWKTQAPLDKELLKYVLSLKNASRLDAVIHPESLEALKNVVGLDETPPSKKRLYVSGFMKPGEITTLDKQLSHQFDIRLLSVDDSMDILYSLDDLSQSSIIEEDSEKLIFTLIEPRLKAKVQTLTKKVKNLPRVKKLSSSRKPGDTKRER